MQELAAEEVAAVWGERLSAVHCERCGAAHLVPEWGTDAAGGQSGALLCPLCLQGAVTLQPAYLPAQPPEQIVPYHVSSSGLSGVLDRWSRRVWFRPDDLKAANLLQRARRYLIPLWLVDGQIEGAWRADVGFDYQVVSHQEQYQEGTGWSSQEVQETKVRWEPRAGRLSRRYENLAASALDDQRTLAARLGDFDLETRSAYVPQALGDAAVRVPSLVPEAAWPGAQTAFVRTAEAECREAAGADHLRAFAIEAQYRDLNWTLLLLPAYVTWYREGKEVLPVLVNGQSGRVSGVKRASVRKANVASLVLGAAALLLFVLGGVAALAGALVPPLLVLAVVFLVLGVLLALTAPVPAIAVRVFNRRSTPAAD